MRRLARNAKYAMFAIGVTPTPELQSAVHSQVTAVKRTLEPYAAAQMFLNFADEARPAGTFWPDHAYRRLQRIKATVDPHDVIRSNHPIAPAS